MGAGVLGRGRWLPESPVDEMPTVASLVIEDPAVPLNSLL